MGQSNSQAIRGTVREAFTNCGIEDALVSVTDASGKTVATATASIPMTAVGAGGGMYQKNKNEGAEFVLPVPAAGKYAVTVRMMGYETDTLHVEATFKGRNKVFDMGDIFHQNNKVRVQLNEQGRYETSVRKYLPSYLMLTIRYQFSTAKKNSHHLIAN